MALTTTQLQQKQSRQKRLGAVGNFLTAPFKNIPNAIKEVGAGINSLRQSRGDEMRASQNRVVQPSQSMITRSKLTGQSPLTTLGPQRPGSLPMSGGRPLSNTMGPVPRPASTAPVQPASQPSQPSSMTNQDAQTKILSSSGASNGGFSSQLDPMDPAAIGGKLMQKPYDVAAGQAGAATNVPTPQQTQIKEDNKQSELERARQAYLQSLAPPEMSEEEKAYQDLIAQQARLSASEELGLNKIKDQPIALDFLTGQSAALQRNVAAQQQALASQAVPLEQRIVQEQARRQSLQAQREAELGFLQSDMEAQNVTPIEVGGRLVNPRTGAVVYSPPAEAGETFTLSPGQRVYGADGKLIAQNDGTTDKFTNVSPGSTVIDSAGNVIYRAPKEGEGTDAKAVQAQVGELDTTIGLVDEIVNNPAFKQVFGLSGVTDPRNYLPGSPAQYLKSQIEQLKAFLALENRQKLKGQGTISDREFKVLTDAATALNAKLGDQDALRELTKLRDALTGRRSELSSGGGGDRSSDPDFQALRNDPDLKNYSDAQIRDILGKTEVGSDTNKLQSVKIGSKNVVVRKEIAPRLEAAAKEFKATTGKDLLINQDYRSSEHQAELYRKSQAGEIGRAAPPGYSRHEHGLAIDVTNWKEAEKILRKYGFKNDLADDRNHFSVGEFV